MGTLTPLVARVVQLLLEDVLALQVGVQVSCAAVARSKVEAVRAPPSDGLLCWLAVVRHVHVVKPPLEHGLAFRG